MRAAVYYNNHDVRIEDRPKPTPGPGELTLKIMASGICGSDVLEWYRIKKAPIVLGHEIAGIVENVAEDVTTFKPGDRVVVSHHVPCMSCRYCLNGDHTVCETLQSTNFDPGGFCEYVRVPAINVDRGVFLMPDSMSFEDGTFCEPLACVARGQRTAGFRAGQTVLIMGSGISGLLHILLAKAQGAERIVATDINDYKLGKAAELGADVTIPATEDVPKRLKEVHDGRGADLVIVCTGAFPAFEQALKSVDRAGTILCFACTAPGVNLPIPINDFWRNSITVMSSYANSPDDLREAMTLIDSGKVDVSSMITHRVALDETDKGFALMADQADCLKIVVLPHD